MVRQTHHEDGALKDEGDAVKSAFGKVGQANILILSLSKDEGPGRRWSNGPFRAVPPSIERRDGGRTETVSIPRQAQDEDGA
jgi:hypothetical protein